MTYTLIIENGISALVLHSSSSSNSLKVWKEAHVSERRKKRERDSQTEMNFGIQKHRAKMRSWKKYPGIWDQCVIHCFSNCQIWLILTEHLDLLWSISSLHVHRGNKCGAARVWQRNSDRENKTSHHVGQELNIMSIKIIIMEQIVEDFEQVLQFYIKMLFFKGEIAVSVRPFKSHRGYNASLCRFVSELSRHSVVTDIYTHYFRNANIWDRVRLIVWLSDYSTVDRDCSCIWHSRW